MCKRDTRALLLAHSFFSGLTAGCCHCARSLCVAFLRLAHAAAALADLLCEKPATLFCSCSSRKGNYIVAIGNECFPLEQRKSRVGMGSLRGDSKLTCESFENPFFSWEYICHAQLVRLLIFERIVNKPFLNVSTARRGTKQVFEKFNRCIYSIILLQILLHLWLCSYDNATFKVIIAVVFNSICSNNGHYYQQHSDITYKNKLLRNFLSFVKKLQKNFS